MPMDFRTTSISFGPAKGSTQTGSATVTFGSPVNRAEVALRGFDLQFTDGDHHLFRQTVNASVSGKNNNSVTVNVTYLLRDSSGNIDDRFQGRVDVLVLADVAWL